MLIYLVRMSDDQCRYGGNALTMNKIRRKSNESTLINYLIALVK